MTTATDAAAPEDTEQNDADVIRQVLQGNTAMFELLMRHYNERVYRAARAIVRDEHEAEDVMQQAYVNAFTHLRQFTGAAQFSTWLTRIAINEALARVRRQGKYEAFDDEREFGRKVRTLAGNYQLIAKLPKLLVPGVNRAWFELVSHKLLRLFCPFALALLLVASATLSVDDIIQPHEQAFWRALLCGQLAFYALAAAGARGGRVGGVARTFVVLNAAAVVGLWRFARRSQTVIW